MVDRGPAAKAENGAAARLRQRYPTVDDLRARARARVPRSDQLCSGRPERPAPVVLVSPGSSSADARTYFTTSVWRKCFRRRNTIGCERRHTWSRGPSPWLRGPSPVTPYGT